MAPEVAAVLKADDTVSRDYFDAAQGASANLFIAYFGFQQQARAPHSPQHCMPGAGWLPVSLTRVSVPVPQGAPIRVNRYILAKANDQVVVYYWYESNRRVIASEYMAKLYLVLDSIRYRRSDTSLVRITVPVANGGSVDQAAAEGVHFVQAAYGPVRELLD